MQWTHVTAVYDYETGVQTIYRNGMTDKDRLSHGPQQPSPSAVKAQGNLIVGSDFSNKKQNRLTGCLDEFRMWSKPLSMSAVEATYTTTQAQTSDLVINLKFDSVSDIALDSSGNDNHGVLG